MFFKTVKIPIELMPMIYEVLNDAQKKISEIASIGIKLSINAIGESNDINYIAWIGLQQAISNASGLSWSKITERSRRKPLPLLKGLYSYIGYEKIGGKTLDEISKDLNYNDHTDVINAIKRFENLLDTNDEVAVKIYKKVMKTLYKRDGSLNTDPNKNFLENLEESD